MLTLITLLHFLKSNANTKPMTTEPSLVNEITDSTSTLSFIRKGLELIDSVYIDNSNINNWISYLREQTLKHQIINDSSAFVKLLQQRNEEQSFALDPYPIAIPHLKSDLIQKPFIFNFNIRKTTII
ncbi:transcriptional antiterminator [Staphylococcus gallinarum]|uniref:Transcriptional antiterminator n=1 Tax=Staphylococcus gallinarum TaxID=1293 RepID=A0A380FLW8_STAGA|nr:transcriptional antiterminator [Staphylococcus gallinarum]